MGFYNEQLAKYLKSIKFSEEQMEQTRNLITLSFEQQLKNLLDKARYQFRHMHMSTTNARIYAETHNQIKLAKEELKHISELSTIDFYDYLVNAEDLSLGYLAKQIQEEIDEITKNIEKYNGREGVFAKITRAERKIEKSQEALQDANLTLDYVNESREEFNTLSPENQVSYIIGRCEVDKKCRFDKVGFNNYKQTYKESIAAKDSLNNVSGLGKD